MIDLLVKIIINAIAVYVAVLRRAPDQLPGCRQPDASSRATGGTSLVVALILALINSYLKPILKALSFPITLLTMGLFALVLNAFLLLLVAFIADDVDINFTIGGFPPSFTADSFIGALLGSIVISIVSIVLGMLDRGRRIVV